MTLREKLEQFVDEARRTPRLPGSGVPGSGLEFADTYLRLRLVPKSEGQPHLLQFGSIRVYFDEDAPGVVGALVRCPDAYDADGKCHEVEIQVGPDDSIRKTLVEIKRYAVSRRWRLGP